MSQVSEGADTFVEVVRSEGGRVTSLLCQAMATAVWSVLVVFLRDERASLVFTGRCSNVNKQTLRRDGMVQIILDALCKIIALSVRTARSDREIRLPNNNC